LVGRQFGRSNELVMPSDPSEKPPFLPILGYVLGFMVVLAILAFLLAALTRLLG
jgi:hypothetical protein